LAELTTAARIAAQGVCALLLATSQGVLARDYCADRPGIDTPPCTIEPGKLSAEVSLGDWTHDADAGTITDTVLLGDMALRYGIAEHAELRFGWTAWGHVRTRGVTGAVDAASGTGDVTLGLKRNLISPDGKGFSLAVLPSVSLPTGGEAIGAGDWGAGLQVPISFPLNKTVSIALTPEIDAAVNSSRHGRHLAYGVAGGLSIAVKDGINLALESQVMRDEDPFDSSTQALAGAAAGFMIGSETQVDLGSEFGLNHNTPDTRVYLGVARRF
jgi:hypothetical protein